jgi:hypothetical protein
MALFRRSLVQFAGRWFTSFGIMTLQQDRDRVTGTYGTNGTENTFEGTIANGVLAFRYQEAFEKGTGTFRLKRHGTFAGEYVAEGNPRALPWQGWREFEGYWETSLGRLRLIQHADRVDGFVEFDPEGKLEGRIEQGRLLYQFAGSRIRASGFIELDSPSQALRGEWQEEGHPILGLDGRRSLPRRGLIWLVVLEAHWQRALDDREYAFGSMLREIFARVLRVQVRHRFFHDEASLLHWCRQLLFLPEPAILVVTGHGEANGLTVNGRFVDMRRMIESLRLADSLQLLHFSSCLVGQDSGQALASAPFAISGYTTRIDWAESALTEFIYLDMMLEKGLAPAKAAAQLVRLVRFAGDEPMPESPYQPAGFRFFPAADPPVLAETV